MCPYGLARRSVEAVMEVIYALGGICISLTAWRRLSFFRCLEIGIAWKFAEGWLEIGKNQSENDKGVGIRVKDNLKYTLATLLWL